MNMEELLKSIETGMKSERDSIVEQSRARHVVLTGHVKILDDIQQKIRETSALLKNEIRNNIPERDALRAELADLRDQNKKEKESHERNLVFLTIQKENLESEIASREATKVTLESHLKGLHIDRETTEKEVLSLLGQRTILERNISDLKSKEDRLSGNDVKSASSKK